MEPSIGTPPTADEVRKKLLAMPPLGFGNTDPSFNAPVPTPAWQASEERLKREKVTRTGNPVDLFTGDTKRDTYLGSIWRQDGLVDGLMAHVVGSEMAPDPAFNPFTAPGTKEAEEGIWDEFKPSLYQAHSAAHREYLRGLLLQKQDDLTRLNDMGMQGTVGRIALNALMPDQLLMSMAGGWVARGAMAVNTARAARSAATALGKAEVAAGISADAARRAGTIPAVLGGIGFGAAENATYEAARQSVNFESDGGQVLEAGILGAAFTAPFAIAGARSASRVASVAHREHTQLKALRAVEEGTPLSPSEGQALKEMVQVHTAVREFQAGRLDEAGMERALDEFHGPAEPIERWMARYGDRLREDAQAIIKENYPGSTGKATGRAAPSAPQRAQMDEAVDLETKVNFPESVAAANAKNPALEGSFQGPFKKTLVTREELRKAFDLQRLDAEADVAKKSAFEDAFKQAEREREARFQAEQELMVNQRELQRMDGVEGAPSEASVTPPAPHPHEAYVGRDVSFAGPDGSTLEGTVTSFNPSIGKLIVKTDEGMKSVKAEELDQYEGPSPFGMQSVGAAQVKGTQIDSVASQRTALAEMTIPGTDVKVPLRFDIFAVLNGSPVKRVRELAHKLVKDAIQNDSFEAQSMTASEWKKQLQRTAAGTFHVQAREAFQEAVKVSNVLPWQRPQFATDFYALVSRVTRGDPDVALEHANIFPMLQKAAGAQAKAYATLIQEAKKAGVKGAEDIAPNDFYVNRVWNHGQIREASLSHGESSVVKVIADAILDKPGVIEKLRKSPGMEAKTDAELLTVKAQRFLAAVRAVQFTPALQDIALKGRDMATLRRELMDLKVDEGHIDELVDLMFEVRPQDADAGRMANLKYRFGLDENTKVQTPAGTLRLSDLFENDARVLVDTYTNSMAGHVGLAKVGIPDSASWARELNAAAEEAKLDPTMDGARVKRDMALLEDVHRNITGRPMSTADFSYTNRAAQAFRGYTRGVMLPQLGIASAFEMSKAVALMGFKSLQQMPSFRSFLVGIRQGYLPDQGLARDIRLITGFGQEKAASYTRAQEIESGFMGQALTRIETGSNKVSHAVDVLSGNASFTSLTKQLSGMMAAQNMADFAHGRSRFTAKLRERWVGQGVSDDHIEGLLADLKKHSTEKDGVLQEIRHEDWNAANPESYERFQTFISRQVRDAIQDHDLGESLPFLHSTLGKMFGELKTFFLVAHAKNFLKNGHYMDATAAQVWAISFLGESLAYMTQTAVNYPTELDERLTPERIATAAAFRMAALGTMSMAIETGFNVLSGGDSLVFEGATSNTSNRSFLNTPSMIVMKRLTNVPATAMGALLGTDVTTQAEFRDVWGAIPGANLYGLKAFGSYLSNTLPKSDPNHSYSGY